MIDRSMTKATLQDLLSGLQSVGYRRAGTMDVLLEQQRALVRDETTAIAAVVCPILEGLLYSLKREAIAQQGGYDRVTLWSLSRWRRDGDGDAAICFEYAIHDAIKRGEPAVVERVSDALKKCRVPAGAPTSILFGAEKTGSQRLVDTAHELLTARSLLLHGRPGGQIRLQSHLQTIADALNRPASREALPHSIAGLWKADLFIGQRDADKWVATTLKINRHDLEAAPGLRIGIVPARETRGVPGVLHDQVVVDDAKGLVICPIPYDGSFMEVFYLAWNVVVQFLLADAQLPASRTLPHASSRHVAKMLEGYRNYPVRDVLEGLRRFGQPGLLEEHRARVPTVETDVPLDIAETHTLLAPIPITI